MGVDHPRDEGALQRGPPALQHVEARPGQLCASLEVYDVQPLADLPVGRGLEVEGRQVLRRTEHDVLVLVLADGHVVAGYVGQRQEEAVELLLDGACLGIQFLDAAADLPHLVDELGRLLLRRTDLPAHLVAAGPEVVALVHHGPALTVQAENAVHVDVIAPQLDGAANAVCVVPYNLDTQQCPCSIPLHPRPSKPSPDAQAHRHRRSREGGNPSPGRTPAWRRNP